MPGLEAEAETLDGLREKVSGAIEDRLRGAARQDVRFELIVPGSVKVGGA